MSGPEPTRPEPTRPEAAGPEATGPEPTGPEPTGSGPARTTLTRTTWHLRAGSVVLAWAVALVAAVAVHPFVPQPRWTLVHLLTLGVLGNAVLVWSWHFATALLRLPLAATLRGQVLRLVAFNAAAFALVGGMVTDARPLVATSGTALGLVVAWHAGALGLAVRRAARRALSGRFAVTLRYLVAAAGLLCCGIAAGVVAGSGALERSAGSLPERVLVAHVVLNGDGWLGLTVAGTLLTLWPTMVRARVPEGAQRRSQQLLPWLVAAVLGAAAAALAGSLALAGAGLVAFTGLLAALARPYRAARPTLGGEGVAPGTAGWAVPVLAAFAWLLATLLAQAFVLVTAPDWARAAEALAWLTPALLVGFGAQVLVGALSFLLPVVLGGGPAAVRASSAVLTRGWVARTVLLDAGLLLALLPVPPATRVVLSVLVAACLAVLPVLAVTAVVRHRRGTSTSWPSAEPTALAEQGAGPIASRPLRTPAARPLEAPAPVVPSARGPVLAPALASLTTVALVVVTGALAGPGAVPTFATVTPTGHTTRVAVRMDGMRFVPDVVDVPLGDRLVLAVTNAGEDRHDLVLATGRRTRRLPPGATAEFDAGVIAGPVAGWCTLPGHRMRGMTLTIRPTGALAVPAAPTADHDMAGHDMTEHAPSDAAPIADADVVRSLAAPPGPASPSLPVTLAPAPATRVHRVTLAVTETRVEVASGLVQTRWTFGGRAPGPVLRGRVGDTFEITLRNDATIGHSIDFHAGSLAPDGPMRTLQPGQSLLYRFTATRAGIWMYHCSTMPMSLHLANGMIGAVVIDPPDLPPVAREYVLVQSELYLGAQGGTADDDALRAERPDLVVFNGIARQYDAHPLAARVGERVRVWVLDAGPQRASSFHVVGAQFDTVWTEGAYLLRPGGSGGAQVLPLVPAQGGFVEFTLPEAGRYPFVTHAMLDAERGAHGVIVATR